MRVHKSVGAVGAQAVPASALYITDRFLEVFAACALAPGTRSWTRSPTSQKFSPGLTNWTVSALNARRSSGQQTTESRQKMIKLKRVYESTGDNDGKKFLVERLWPRGVKKTALADAVWLKDVAPSTELRKWFSHDPKKWTEFQRRYQAELKQHEEALEPILQAARHGTVTLLYSSHDTEHNNAVVLREYMEGKLGANRESKRGKSAA